MAGQLLGVIGDDLGGERATTVTGLDRLLDPPDRVVDQQLQHPDVVPRAGADAVELLERPAQLFKRLGQLPGAEHV